MKFLKYFLTFLFPWVTMLIIEENTAALICFFLQLTFIGWIPAGIYGCKKLKQHMLKQEAGTPTTQEPQQTNEK
jgi:hypothetical protein